MHICIHFLQGSQVEGGRCLLSGEVFSRGISLLYDGNLQSLFGGGTNQRSLLSCMFPSHGEGGCSQRGGPSGEGNLRVSLGGQNQAERPEGA